MTFTILCVTFVIIIGIFLVSALFGFCTRCIGDSDDETEVFLLGAWFICAVGFGVCLTIILVQNGVI